MRGLDPKVLGQIREVGGEPLLRDLFQTFVDLAGPRLSALHDGLAARDPEQVADTAHSIRSAAATVGARQLSQVAGEVEEGARAGGLDRSEVSRLERELALTLGHLRLLLDKA